MQKSKIPSPSRSQGAPITPRRGRPRRTRSVASPALSLASGRLTSVIEHFKENNMESFALSPLSSRRSVLTDNTDIEEPRRRSWWKNLKENSRDVMEVLEDNKAVEDDQAIEELIDFEVLSQEKKNYTLDLPESSGSESIQSIVVPQRKLFTQKNHAKTKYSQLVNTRESLAKKSSTSTHNTSKTLNAGTRELFHGTKRTKPIFPAALLDITPNKTIADKTKELAVEPKQIRNIFGNRPANKRKNMFANFILTDSEEDNEEIQPKVFGFQKKADPVRGAEPPSSNITSDIDMDDWRHLPSSTMVEHQLEEMMRGQTPVKRARLENPDKETNRSRKNVSKRFALIQEDIIDEDVDESPKKVTRTLLEMLESSEDDISDDEIKEGIIKQQDRKKNDAIDGPTTNNAENQELVDDAKVYEENEDGPASTSHANIDNDSPNLENQKVNNESQELENIGNETQDFKDGDENKNGATANESLIGHQEQENEASGDINHVSNRNENDDAEKTENSEVNDEAECSADVSQEVENEADENENDKSEHNIDNNDEIQENEVSVAESQVEDDAEESDNENDQEMEDDNEEVNNESEENEVSINHGVNESQVEDDAEESDNENDQEMEDDNEEVNNESEENEVSVNHGVNESQVENDAEESDNENDQEMEDDNEEVNNESEENEVSVNHGVNESQVEDDAEESDNENDQEMEDDNEEVNNESEENEVSINRDVNDSQVEDDAEESEIENDPELEDGEDADKAIANGETEPDDDQVEEMEEDHQELKYESDVEETSEQNGSTVEIEGTPNTTHDTTGRNRKKPSDKSPEVILHEKSNQSVSFTAQRNNTSIRKTLLKSLHIRPSMAPPRESTGVSSEEGSGWDSHRTTRKTMRQTFGKDFTIRKSLRTLVMEKSAKRQTEHGEIQSETVKLPQANSTELPDESGRDADVMGEEMVEESDHEVSIRTRRNILLTHIQRIQQENLEKRLKIREAILNRIKPPTRDPLNIFIEPSKPAPRRAKPSQNTKKQIKTITPFGSLPPEMIEDLKYKPPKRFAPASWTTKRLYKFLETKLEPRYDYKARVRAEKLVETIFNFVKGIRRHKTAPLDAVDALKHEMARLDIVKTHFEFYNFFHEFMPREVRIKVNPDIVNMIPLPRNGVFADILNTVH